MHFGHERRPKAESPSVQFDIEGRAKQTFNRMAECLCGLPGLPVAHVGVAHGGTGILMAEKLLGSREDPFPRV